MEHRLTCTAGGGFLGVESTRRAAYGGRRRPRQGDCLAYCLPYPAGGGGLARESVVDRCGLGRMSTLRTVRPSHGGKRRRWSGVAEFVRQEVARPPAIARRASEALAERTHGALPRLHVVGFCDLYRVSARSSTRPAHDGWKRLSQEERGPRRPACTAWATPASAGSPGAPPYFHVAGGGGLGRESVWHCVQHFSGGWRRQAGGGRIPFP